MRLNETSWLIIAVSIAGGAVIASWIFLAAWLQARKQVQNLTRTLDSVEEDAQKSRMATYSRMSQAFYHGCRWQAANPGLVATPKDNPYLLDADD